MLDSLLNGDSETFEEILAEYLEKTLSYFDVGGNKRRGENLDNAVQAALQQISSKNYRQEMMELGIYQIIELGIAFDGKEVLVRQKP